VQKFDFPTIRGAGRLAQSSTMASPCPWCAAPARRAADVGVLVLRWLLATWLALVGPGEVLAQGQTLDFGVALRAIGGEAEPDWSHGQLVALPDDWTDDIAAAGAGNVWYRVSFDGGRVAGSDVLFGLYIERACSVLQARLNGQLVHSGGATREPVSRQCGQPQLVALPAAMLTPRGNRLDLRVTGFAPAEVTSPQRAGGLSSLQIGPYDLMREHHQRRLLFAVQLPQVMSGALMLMGSFMFVMGWFNRAQSYLAYFGALMIGCALSLTRLWLTDLPWPNRITELMLAALLGFITLAAVQFLMRYAGQRRRWLDRALPAQCALVVLSLAAAGRSGLHLASSAWAVVLWPQIAVAAVAYLRLLQRQHNRQRWLMGMLLGIVALALATEFVAQQLALDARIGYVAQLVPSLVFLLLGLRLLQQFGRAYQSSEQIRAELERRIADATAQIERNFAQLSELKVEQVTDRERKRIAADLHDDLGAKLLTIVHTSDSERISTLAREALEEMRLSVRGLTGKPVKLLDALGDWRAEVVSRLNQSGIESEWSAPSDDELPQTLSSRAYVQTTRILREAVSNIIKHSRASRCTVDFTLSDGDFHLVIQDNGRGIPAALDGRLDKGHGMVSMKGRAKQLRGQCLVESGPGHGTVIRLTLPLDRHVTAG
jgi:two-component system, NarL family, sensor histidine kinase UhpB